MQVNLVTCLFALNSEKNDNIRKNDIQTIKVLVDSKNNLPTTIYKEGDMKQAVRDFIKVILGTSNFHLEQVFTMEGIKGIDVIYLAITNQENCKINEEYQFIPFAIHNNERIQLGEKSYSYNTKEKKENKNIEYIHEIKAEEEIKRTLLELLISYKKIRSNIDNTDIIFKFMGNIFTLEDVRKVYELIKDTEVDKSNFRKKIIKYCKKIEIKDKPKSGYRPSQAYQFQPLEGDIWI